MKKIKFKCPDCKSNVVIEGTDVKMCPYCGWKDIDILKKDKK